jgi:NAD+ synthase (glutamine-hydrolysing)
MASITHPPSSSHAHVGVASLNQTVGDWIGNTLRILEVIQKAKMKGVQLLLLPEMAISGYSLGDRLLHKGTLTRSYQVLQRVASAREAQGLIVCVGLPISHRGVIYNAVAVLAEGKIKGLIAKEHLATGDVEYEERWFQAWPSGLTEVWIAPDGQRFPIGNLIFEAQGVGRFAFEVCEDAWRGNRPGSRYAVEGAELILNPSASWFSVGKHAQRRHMICQNSRADHCAYLYASLLGCDNTRLIFDGALLIAADGALISEGDRLRFCDSVLESAVVDLDNLRRARREVGSWRRQVSEAAAHPERAPQVVHISHNSTPVEPPEAPPAPWLAPSTPHADPSLAWLEREGLIEHSLTHQDLPHIELELALSLGLDNYTKKANIDRLALALSGGRDSAMVALLVHRMLHYRYPGATKVALKRITEQTLITAYLSTDNSGEATRTAAHALAQELGATFHDLSIQEAFKVHQSLIEGAIGHPLSWRDDVQDLALQNVQARLRGSVIWFLANLNKALLLTTSNKSEAAVGYTTMDGDTSGGLAPIADVPKSLVSLWLAWAERFHGYESLKLINHLAPTAELRPSERAQTDEDDLMPFEVLDRLIYGFAQLRQDPKELFVSLWPSLKGRYEGDARAFKAHIHTFIRLFCFAQWKRERFAVSFRVSAFDLDPKSGGRYPVIQAPFTEELAELDAYVEELTAEGP